MEAIGKINVDKVCSSKTIAIINEEMNETSFVHGSTPGWVPVGVIGSNQRKFDIGSLSRLHRGANQCKPCKLFLGRCKLGLPQKVTSTD